MSEGVAVDGTGRLLTAGMNEVEYGIPVPIAIQGLVIVPACLLGMLGGAGLLGRPADGEMFAAALFLLALFAFYVALDRSYRVLWDEHCLLVRHPSLKGMFGRGAFERVAVDDITDVAGAFLSRAVGARPFMLFDTICIFDGNAYAERPLVLSPFHSRSASLIEMLEHVRGRRPEAFADDVLEFMSTGTIDRKPRLRFKR